MNLKSLKPYIDILTTLHYIKHYQNLEDISLSQNDIYKAYVTLFRKKENKDFFEDRINTLKENDIITDNLMLNTKSLEV